MFSVIDYSLTYLETIFVLYLSYDLSGLWALPPPQAAATAESGIEQMRTSNTTAAVPLARAKAIALIPKLAAMTIAHGATANEQKVARSKSRSLIRRFDLVLEDVLSALGEN